MQTLTERQQEVFERLSQDPPMNAKQIAEELGITRNAVYQQITALKRKGALASTFTPSGEIRTQPGRAEQIIGFVGHGNGHTQPANEGALDVVKELVDQNSRLIEQNARLIDLVTQLSATT